MKHIICIVFLYGFTSARPENSDNGKPRFEDYNNEARNFRYVQSDNSILQDNKEAELNLAANNSQASVISDQYSVSTPDSNDQKAINVSEENKYSPQVTMIEDQNPSTINNKTSLENNTENASNSDKPLPEEPVLGVQELQSKDSQKEENKTEDSQPQALIPNSMQNSTDLQQMNNTTEEEVPDRIGGAVIATLAGPG